MSNIFESVTEKLGLSKEAVTEQAENLLDQHRDQIPDAIEGKIDEALHSGMLDRILEKVGIGGHAEAATNEEETQEESEDSEEEEASDEEVAEDESEEESEEEAEGDESSDEEEASDEDSEEEEASDESEEETEEA